MSRITSLVAWIVGAAGSTVAYWYVVVYLFDEFNHGYGRDAWFQLNVYLSMLAVLVGLIGYAVLTIFRRGPRTFAAACLSGAAFTVCELLFVFALGRVFPDRDMVIQGLAGALVIGALSIFLARPNAA
jgi:L-lactate permease